MCIYSFPFLVVLQMVLMQMFHAAIYCSCVGTVTNTAGPSSHYSLYPSIEPNYHNSPSLRKKSELPNLVDKYLTTGMAKYLTTGTVLIRNSIRKASRDRQQEKWNPSRASYTNYFLYKFYLFASISKTHIYTTTDIEEQDMKYEN